MAGLPESYPQEGGRSVSWHRCQPIGQQAWDQGLPGIACRSAAPGAAKGDEELAWFERHRALKSSEVLIFADWFWPA